MITTHVLDTALGKPGVGIAVTLSRLEAEATVLVAQGTTNDDGRIPGWLDGEPLVAGCYQISFALDDYFAAQGGKAFYPKAEIVFKVENPAEHFHIPLLLSPFGYSTYRGS